MEHAVLRRIVVIDDPDLAKALRNDELTEEELAEHMADGSLVSYEHAIAEDADAAFLCAAVGIDPGEENELADSDVTAMSWAPDAVAEAHEILDERLKEPASLAADLIAHALSVPDIEDSCNVNEVIDILEKVDRGYEPDEDAHLAVFAAAWLVRHVLAFRVADRNDAWVVSL